MNTSSFMVKLGGVDYPLLWNNGAIYRADLLGLPDRLAKGQHGYSILCQMIWVMLDAKARFEMSDPEEISELVPLKEASKYWVIVLKAYEAGNGTEGSEPKNATGGSGAGPA